MPRENMTSKTGNAPIVKQGHTATSHHGSDPNIKGKYVEKPRDLSIKGSGGR